MTDPENLGGPFKTIGPAKHALKIVGPLMWPELNLTPRQWKKLAASLTLLGGFLYLTFRNIY